MAACLQTFNSFFYKGDFFGFFCYCTLFNTASSAAPSDSTVLEDAGIEPRNAVATSALTAIRSNHLAKSRPVYHGSQCYGSVFTLRRIRIRLFTLMRIRVLLSLWCGSGSDFALRSGSGYGVFPNFDTDPDPNFLFWCGSGFWKQMRFPTIKNYAYMQQWSEEPPWLHFSLRGSIVSLHSSRRVNFHGSRLVTFHPDPAFHCDANPDLASQNDAHPNLQHCLQKWRQTTGYKIFEPSFQLHLFHFFHWLFYWFLDLDHRHTLLFSELVERP